MADFLINFGPSKSAVLIRWCGDGAHTAQQQINENGVQATDGTATHVVPIVATYKQMGIATSFSASKNPEIIARTKSAKAVARPIC